MRTFKVKIVETLSRNIAVEAENTEEAERIVHQRYNNGEYILGDDDFDGTSFFATGNDMSYDAARLAELQFLLNYAEGACFDEEISCDHLRMLWTAYCLHHNIDVDTRDYDMDLTKVWEVVDNSADWSDYYNFDGFMCRYLV